MRLIIIRPDREPSNNKSGIGGYSDMIEGVSERSDFDVEVAEFRLAITDGIARLVSNTFKAFLQATKLSKNDICHVTYDGSAIPILLCRAKVVTTFHHIVDKDEGLPMPWYILWRISHRIAIRKSKILISISEQTTSELIDSGADPQKIETIPYALDNGFSRDTDLEKKRIVGCVGSLIPRKNYASLIRVFKEFVSRDVYSDYQLKICGKGPEKERLNSMISDMGLKSKVTFVQDLDYEELNIFYNECALICNTSLHEGLGLQTIEAQLCGTPVLYLEQAKMSPDIMRCAVGCTDEMDMVSTMIRLLENRSEYDDIVNRGIVFAKIMQSEGVERTLEVYKKLAGE